MNATRFRAFVVAALCGWCVGALAMEWETDFAHARTNALTTGRYLLLDFSGSDWCGWCIKLDKEVFSQQAFQTFASSNLVCVLIDFPRAKKQSKELQTQNEKLAQQYNVRGFPTVILLSPDGEWVGRTGYQPGGARKYVQHIQDMIEAHKRKRDAAKK